MIVGFPKLEGGLVLVKGSKHGRSNHGNSAKRTAHSNRGRSNRGKSHGRRY
jgi:hypothetical protein